ncbi:MAG: hypothetical protein ACRDT6_13480, partial [Micromonosporaceae bacterium]
PATGKVRRGGGVGAASRTERAIQAAITVLVASAPPLSEAVRARLAELFSAVAGAHHRPCASPG